MQLISTLVYGRNLDGITALNKDDVLHVYDIFDQAYVDEVVSQKGTPGAIISDHLTVTPPYSNPIPFYGPSLWVAKEQLHLIKHCKLDDIMVTSNCFNFMINKKLMNRYLCIKLVQHFKLSNYDYTFSDAFQYADMSDILSELNSLGDQAPLDQATRGFLLSPIKFNKRFIGESTATPNEHYAITYSNNQTSWNQGLSKVFSQSAISLITESVDYHKTSCFTEKTLFSLLGLTFPIWVGGQNQATQWKNLGFDTFDDIIDHSYQSYDTLIERCYYAFERNLDLLSNKAKATELRLQCEDRLRNNRDLLLNDHFGTVVRNQISKYPVEIQSCIPEIMAIYFPELLPKTT